MSGISQLDKAKMERIGLKIEINNMLEAYTLGEFAQGIYDGKLFELAKVNLKVRALEAIEGNKKKH